MFPFPRAAFNMFTGGGNGFQAGPIARCQELGQFHARLADRKDQLFGRLNGRHIQRHGLGGVPLQRWTIPPSHAAHGQQQEADDDAGAAMRTVRRMFMVRSRGILSNIFSADRQCR